ncbi:phage tail protein [Nostoc minutum NIES-26]|uniref:Phage tail protein n=1 Tax=Nostoc minutum NIES-26 TaxID=1844469 RepID=A0A367S0P7_9NOSO|nr:phage tail protein [Nostoc minutum NIES-26]
MANSSRNPVFFTASNFYLDLKLDGSSDLVDAVFLECQGFDYSQDVIEFCEVTSSRWGKASKGKVVRTKLPGNAKSGNLTLLRGMTSSAALWKWFELTEDGNWAKQRKNAILTIHEDGKPQARFELTAAWPSRYKILDVKSNSQEIEIEEVEVAYEGFKRVK